jgi:hypothetical protein
VFHTNGDLETFGNPEHIVSVISQDIYNLTHTFLVTKFSAKCPTTVGVENPLNLKIIRKFD